MMWRTTGNLHLLRARPERVVGRRAVGFPARPRVAIDHRLHQPPLGRALELGDRPVDVPHVDHRGAQHALAVVAAVLDEPVVEHRAAITRQIVVLDAHRIEHRGGVEDLRPDPVLVVALEANRRILGRAEQLLLQLALAVHELAELEGLEPGEIEAALLALPAPDLARHCVAPLVSQRLGPQIDRLDNVRVGRDQPVVRHPLLRLSPGNVDRDPAFPSPSGKRHPQSHIGGNRSIRDAPAFPPFRPRTSFPRKRESRAGPAPGSQPPDRVRGRHWTPAFAGVTRMGGRPAHGSPPRTPAPPTRHSRESGNPDRVQHTVRGPRIGCGAGPRIKSGGRLWPPACAGVTRRERPMTLAITTARCGTIQEPLFRTGGFGTCR